MRGYCRDDRVTEEYFEWMKNIVCDHRYTKYHRSWTKLLRLLHSRKFIYILEMDSNRAAYGVDLRYRFAYDENYSYDLVQRVFKDRECSVLEMMVALSMSCENDIMEDSDYGNRTGEWFFDMIESLGLDDMYDSNFNEAHANRVIDKFLAREYEPNGRGGLFTVSDPNCDMRKIDIWYQMMHYLNELVYGG